MGTRTAPIGGFAAHFPRHPLDRHRDVLAIDATGFAALVPAANLYSGGLAYAFLLAWGRQALHHSACGRAPVLFCRTPMGHALSVAQLWWPTASASPKRLVRLAGGVAADGGCVAMAGATTRFFTVESVLTCQPKPSGRVEVTCTATGAEHHEDPSASFCNGPIQPTSWP